MFTVSSTFCNCFLTTKGVFIVKHRCGFKQRGAILTKLVEVVLHLSKQLSDLPHGADLRGLLRVAIEVGLCRHLQLVLLLGREGVVLILGSSSELVVHS